jgi:hypothetical protein
MGGPPGLNRMKKLPKTITKFIDGHKHNNKEQNNQINIPNYKGAKVLVNGAKVLSKGQKS